MGKVLTYLKAFETITIPSNNDPIQVEERILRRGAMNLRIIINHSHRHMRFMDYRVGNYSEKCEILDALAKQLSLHKIFTLVEKQDSRNWHSAGFVREGIYPSFFRTADAYAMCRLYNENGEPQKTVLTSKTEIDDYSSATERCINIPEGIRIECLDERSRKNAFSQLNGNLKALPFGRAAIPDVVLHAKANKKEKWICAEIDDSFGHATVSFAPTPKKEDDLALSSFASNSLFSMLKDREVKNLFGLSSTEDAWSNELFAGLGFKVTGKLAEHWHTDDGFSAALIWHRRLGQVTTITSPELE